MHKCTVMKLRYVSDSSLYILVLKLGHASTSVTHITETSDLETSCKECQTKNALFS